MPDTIPIEVPAVGESISEVQIANWLKGEGDSVSEGEDIVEIETEKASVQIPAPASGTLVAITIAADEFAGVGDTIGQIDPAGGAAGSTSDTAGSKRPANDSDAPTPGGTSATRTPSGTQGDASVAASQQRDVIVMPAARRLLDEHGLSADDVPATGPGNRLLKEDVQKFVRQRGNAPAAPAPAPTARPTPPTAAGGAPSTSGNRSMTTAATSSAVSGSLVGDTPPHRMEEVKSMSMLRRTIASRLVEAQQTAALLTTFNEIDMQPVMALRSKYRDAFADKHGVKLGFMSFFAKAAVEALRRFPAINAEIRDNQVVYRHYHDIGIAIGGGKGLVVPVLRNVERMSFADIERSIGDYAKLAGENRLQPDDLMGGTFTISNGGVYGSLLSTPIVNPPQSGILGLHSIQQRPVAVDGEVVIRPMMYIALTYDHRIVDGREAVGFLKTIKEVIEDPARLFLEV